MPKKCSRNNTTVIINIAKSVFQTVFQKQNLRNYLKKIHGTEKTFD